MIDLNEPVVFFLLIMSIILVTPLLSERVRLPGIIGIILGGMLIGPHILGLVEDSDRMQYPVDDRTCVFNVQRGLAGT